MQNFDLNMKFFEKLNHVKFENEIAHFIKRTKFFEIADLSKYSCPGYYVIVLDKYCQLYVGTAKDIKRRVKQHWAGGKLKFDRLICVQITKSKLSIDSFTNEFVCNRIGGGIMEFGILSATANMKTRNLE